MADEQAQERSQPQYYDHMTLPGKGPVYFRDSKLLRGKNFSISGDVEADPVSFTGANDVVLVASLGNGVVGLPNMSASAVTGTLDDLPPGDPRLPTAGAVLDKIEELPVCDPIPDEDIDALFP